ncbi:TRAP transporter permease [Thermodesulfobacteriota bacterium]
MQNQQPSTASRYREYTGVLGKIVTVAAVVFSLYHIIYAFGILQTTHFYIDVVPHRAIHLGLVLFITFLIVPWRKGKATKLTWYDALFAVFALVWNAYLVLNWDNVHAMCAQFALPKPLLISAIVNGVLVFEASRRLIGLIMPSIAACFVIYLFTSSYLPGFLRAGSCSTERVICYIGLWADGIYGMLLGMSATFIVMFILFAQFLNSSGAGEFMMKLAYCAMGRFRGGPAKVAVLASAFFGTISGSAAANVAATGSMTIPLMKHTGYKPHFAAAVESVASNGGQLTPPIMGIVAFIMAEFLGIPYWQICVAAALPATIYFVVLLTMVDLEAAKEGLHGLPLEEIPSLRKTLKEGWQFIIPIVVLVIFLMVLKYSPMKSALYSLLTMTVVAQFGKGRRFGMREILGALVKGAQNMLDVACISAIAGVLVGAVSLSGLGTKLASGLTHLAGGNLVALLFLTAITCIIMGMGVTTSGVYVILAILVAPALVQIGLLPIVAHFFVFWWGMSAMITPPVCPTVYVASGLADCNPWPAGWTATRLGIATYLVPFAFVYDPALLMIGKPIDVFFAATSALIGSLSLAAGLQGYVLYHANWLERLLLVFGGSALIIPGLSSDLIGILLIAMGLMRQVRLRLSR